LQFGLRNQRRWSSANARRPDHYLGPVDWDETQWHNACAPAATSAPTHAAFVALQRGSDGTLTDNSGFGNGMFTIELTGVDDKVVSDTFPWPSGGIAGQTLTGAGNFQ
jgi:hypothetical protein